MAKHALVRICNDNWKGEPFTEPEVEEYIELLSIGSEISLEGWGEQAHKRWLKFLEASKAFDAAPAPMEMQVVQSALEAGSNNLLENFQYSQATNQWEMTKDVSLEAGYNILGDMLSINKAAKLIGDESSWLIGNVASKLQDKFGDKYDPSVVAKALGRDVTTIMANTAIFNAFQGRRVHGVSYSIHKEIYYRKNLPVEEGFLVLEAARDNNLSVREVRRLCKQVANYVAKHANKDGNIPERFKLTKIDSLMIEDAVMARNTEVKYKYFCIRANGEPVVKEGTLSDQFIRTALYITMIQPVVRVIKDYEKLK